MSVHPCSQTQQPLIFPAGTRWNDLEVSYRNLALLGLLVIVTVNLLSFTPIDEAYAELAPISSSGLSTHVSDPVTVGGKTQFNITGGTRPGGGANLFHSFENFNVPHNAVANFRNDSTLPTENILGRVTGGNISYIYGTVNTTEFGHANLFLMNPAGFVFGPSASLNVGGSVTFTSANYFRLEDEARFNAAPNSVADGLLTASPLAAFGFLGSNPGAILIQGSQLKVAEGAGISFIGGSLTVESDLTGATTQRAHLSAPDGMIQLASTRSRGEFDTFIQPIQVDGVSFQSFGSVALAPSSIINLRGTDTVSIRGGQFALTVQDAVLTTAANDGAHTTISLNQSAIRSVTTSAMDAGNILLRAETVQLTNSTISTRTQGAGNAGNLTIESERLQAESSLLTSTTRAPQGPVSGNGGVIALVIKQDANLSNTFVDSQTITNGKAGDIYVKATGLTLMSSQLTTGTTPRNLQTSFTGGHAGDITVNVNRLVANDGLILSQSSFSAGNAGVVTINASDSISTSGTGNLPFAVSTVTKGAAPFCPGICGNAGRINIQAPSITLDHVGLSSSTTGMGNSGDILIETQNLKILNGAQITASAEGPVSTGDGGTITIHDLSGLAPSIILNGHGSSISTKTEGTGIGGNIHVTSKSMLLQDGSTVSADTSGPGQDAKGGSIIITATDQLKLTDRASIGASTSGAGDAGQILIKANDVSITGGAKITAESTGAGNAGTVTIQGLNSPANSFLLDGLGSSILTSTRQTGAGGNILVNANNIMLTNGGKISAETSGTTGSATGGTISVQGDRVRIENGALVTSATSGAAKGGAITVTARESVSINDGATISASSKGLGDAGNITIHAGQRFTSRNGVVTTNSSQSTGGDIEIKASDLVSMVNGRISTSVLGGTGNGGNISIDPNMVVLQNSQIMANAIAGHGGNITITTPLFLADQSSLVDASSQFGLNGTVTIQSPTSNLSGTVGQLTSTPSPVHLLVQNRCVALANGQPSTLIVGGRQTFSTTPGGWASSPMLMAIGTGEPLGVRSDEQKTSFPFTSESEILSLRELTPQGFLVRSFANDVQTGCRL